MTMSLTSDLLVVCTLLVGCMAAPHYRYMSPYEKRSRPYNMAEYQEVQPDERWREAPRWRGSDWESDSERAYNYPPSKYNELERALDEARQNEIAKKYHQLSDNYNPSTRDEEKNEDEGPVVYVNYNTLYKDLVRLSQRNTDVVSDDQYRGRPDTYYEADDYDGWQRGQIDQEDSWQRQPIDEDMLRSLFEGSPAVDEKQTESELTYAVKPKNHMSLLQRIGMRMIDLSEQTTPVETKIKNIDEDDESDPDPPITVEKAKSLLQQLQTEEKIRANSDTNKHSKELVGENELAAMFGKNMKTGQSEQSTETVTYSTASHESDKRKESENSKGSEDDNDDEVGEEEVKEKIKDALLGLLQEQNKLLVNALEYAPLEAIQSHNTAEKIRGLIKGAIDRQNDIDYLHQSMGELTDRM